ncbi:MAG: GNAT family N-acetyltransferase [Lachnospiraceae bacterium]|nr:GNAT family N-acetyltransferase [Lachnospiraceae bacterium]
MKLQDKKLLILGATVGEISLVRRAQMYGIYVIVTDNHTDYTLAPAKNVADEAWNISWSDIDALEKMCCENGIDGVLAGYSEFRVENMIKLCARLGLPCYINDEQLEITRDKIKFKECCRKYGIPVVKEYSSVNDVNEYPVIVKPTDRAGSIGISIAHNFQELEKAYQYAYNLSIEKRVIIEKYIQDADKVDFYYLVENGNLTLLTSCDTINAQNNDDARVVQTAWLYPEKHQASYENKVKNNIETMIRGMGIKYGCIFFSGFIDKEQNFVFFECGYRLEGAHQYYYTQKRGPVNFLDTFIYHALCGETKEVHHTQVNEKMKCVTVNVFAKEGKIAKIFGIEDISQMPDCTLALLHGKIGEQCKADKAILNKVCVFAFSSESVEQLKCDVDEAYKKLQIIDEQGNDMIYDRLDTNKILEWGEYSEVIIQKWINEDIITLDRIQMLLSKSHSENISKGLVYATATQTPERLKQKIGDGICFVAVENGKLVGTATVCQKKIDYWYYTGTVALIKLVAVDPDNKHSGIGTQLIETCINYAKENGIKVVVTDSAEENAVFGKLAKRCGFKVIDYCKYKANNFVSTVYALFTEKNIAPSNEETEKYLMWKHENIVEKE